MICAHRGCDEQVPRAGMICDGCASEAVRATEPAARKHSHYFKAVPFSRVDVYRVLQLFAVTDPCIQHAIKKLLVPGGRGEKDVARDIQDAIDTLTRWQEMRTEEAAVST